MKKIRTMALVTAALAFVLSTAIEAKAQVEPERLRFDWVTGVLLSGELASSTFVFDTTPFGGDRTERSGGWLDIDPSLWFGLETTWRLNSRFSVSGSWMHSTGHASMASSWISSSVAPSGSKHSARSSSSSVAAR